MPKTVSPTIRRTFNGAFSAGVGVSVGPRVGDGSVVGSGVSVGAGVSGGMGVGGGGGGGADMFEAVRFNSRLSPVSQVPVSIAW